MMKRALYILLSGGLGWLAGATNDFAANHPPADSWKVGTPIVTYWCGSALTDTVAGQMADGGWNLVWCGEADLDLVRRHGLRAQLTDGLLTPASLDHPAQREKLDGLIARVRAHPARYAYYLTAMKEAGCVALPTEAAFRLETARDATFSRGFLLGCFGSGQQPTHVVVVNLDDS